MAETSSTVAGWLSFAVTTVGLGSLITQASAINEKMDPFHANRSAEYLGIWFQRQTAFPWWKIGKPPPQGPIIVAKLDEGFCGTNVIHASRVPLTAPGMAGWTVLLAILHPEAPSPPHSSTISLAESAEKASTATTTTEISPASAKSTNWHFLVQRPLVRHRSSACIQISRTSLITLMILTNARPVFQYSDAAGFRAGYGSYSGQWYITWPIGQDAFVSFAAHDSHKASTDVYPLSFVQRVDRCVQMLAGVVSGSGLQVAFCGRKPPGRWVLEYAAKGFPGAHGSRHLYNMMGGKVYEVDFLFARNYEREAKYAPPEDNSFPVITLPSTEKGRDVFMTIPTKEEEIIKHTLDCLPWTSLSWSIHRGMRDILVAYAKPVMDKHRQALAQIPKDTIKTKPHKLDARGWNPQFVRENMGDMAASAILAGSGNSGDLVRVVTDIVLVSVGIDEMAALDECHWWRENTDELTPAGVVALTKLFVLEWSNEFDYQMYHDLPISLYFG
ncbi:hypothetical protein BDV96DRAFT_55630 [Lophiotrema nucula]|uniref:Uncharacterized protein n=1 Tax=Lophiotrema nucula TaxID=690887 RepID=A0A6A5Z8B7_9PLEO|nr:hypothetical protein BDV96DRAFT_55630 [Lophiotrema nucula]